MKKNITLKKLLSITVQKLQYLTENRVILQNKKVLDLACHDGESTKIIHDLGAQYTIGVDVRQELIDLAKSKISTDKVEFVVRDITDYDFMTTLVSQCNTITCFGVLYHLFDHFRFFQKILSDNVEHVLFETEYGSESLNPEMFWGFEKTDHKLHGYAKNLSIIPNGTPNLSWILNAAAIFGFECDWIQYYGKTSVRQRKQITLEEYLSVAGPDWPSYQDLISDVEIPQFVEAEIAHHLRSFTSRRMILRLFNKALIQSKPICLADVYNWPY
jgi:hypothetical protein